MAKHFRFFFILPLLLLFSCGGGSGKPYKPAHSGVPGEVVIIAEDKYWDGALGDTVRAYMEAYQMGLPQPEYLFNLGQYSQAGFSKIVKLHRNLILFDIDPKWNEPYMEILEDVWSNGQIVIKILSKDQAGACELFSREGQKIVQFIQHKERDRLKQKYSVRENTAITGKLLMDHQLGVVVPTDCELAVNKKNFVWITRDRIRYVSGEAHDVDEGIFIYHYPYVDDSTFTLEYLLSVRDSVLKANVPGPTEGSYMTTERHPAYFPFFKEVTFNDKFAFEIRGLYRTVNDFYGGPFISLTTYDEPRKRIVTVEGFVFAPKFHKREYLREVESIVYSLFFDESGASTTP